MSIARLYRLVEAKGRMVSPQEAEKIFPGSVEYFDVDVPGGISTFFLDGVLPGTSGKPELWANTKGNGWWRWDPLSKDVRPDGHWVNTEKPAKGRGAGHKFSRIPDGEEENIGYEEALKFYGNKAMSALRAMGIDPQACSFDIIDGRLYARVWYEGAGDLDGSYWWNEKLKIWTQDWDNL